jgi:hypothetical protein
MPERATTRLNGLDEPARFSSFVKSKLGTCAPISGLPGIGFFCERARALTKAQRCREFLPAPLWGGGREMWHLGASRLDPPPQPSPTRGEGVRPRTAAPNLARVIRTSDPSHVWNCAQAALPRRHRRLHRRKPLLFTMETMEPVRSARGTSARTVHLSLVSVSQRRGAVQECALFISCYLHRKPRLECTPGHCPHARPWFVLREPQDALALPALLTMRAERVNRLQQPAPAASLLQDRPGGAIDGDRCYARCWPPRLGASCYLHFGQNEFEFMNENSRRGCGCASEERKPVL